MPLLPGIPGQSSMGSVLRPGSIIVGDVPYETSVHSRG